MQFATTPVSFTAVVRAASYSNKGLAQILGVGVGVELEEPDELQAVAFMLSAEPRFATAAGGWRRFSVPLPLLSCDLRRLWRRVKVPLRSGEAASCTSTPLPSQIVISPTSFNWRVMVVNGRLGFIEGLRLIVPVVNSESKPLLSSERQPLDEDEEARETRPLELDMLETADETLPHCEGTADEMLLIDSLRIDTPKLVCDITSPKLRSSMSVLWFSHSCLPYFEIRIAVIHFSIVSKSSAQSIFSVRHVLPNEESTADLKPNV